MRIIINPIYIEKSDLLNSDDVKKIIILKAYLTIILIHEVIHLIKFCKEKEKEGGEVFIEYLFGIGKIKNISYEQAEKLLIIKIGTIVLIYIIYMVIIKIAIIIQKII